MRLALALVAASAMLYTIHYAIFLDPHHIFIYMVGDIAFVPMEVLFVTLFIERLLNRREKRAKLRKLNMVIGIFFSEMGSELLRSFAMCDPQRKTIKGKLDESNLSAKGKTPVVSCGISGCCENIDCRDYDLDGLKVYLTGKRKFLLNLMGNPNLMEHDSFAEMLWAVLHIAEELAVRKDLKALPDTDYDHISGDMRRAYGLLILEWLSYMQHLKNDYPYLFSLAIRMNPFDLDVSPVIS